jgi:hypothetical protein
MFDELKVLHYLVGMLRTRWQLLRAEPEAGYSTEAVVVIALLVVMAIAAVAIIAAKVLAKANSISTGS